MFKVILLSFSLLCLQANVLMSQSIQKSEDLTKVGLVTANVHSVMAIQETAIKSIPIQLYSEYQLRLQKSINENATESVVVHQAKNDVSEWTVIDREDITPVTWRWIDIEQMHSNGDTSLISLRRPLWWLEQHHATSVGNTIYIDMPEMGIESYANVTCIRDNQLDSRLLPTKDSLDHTIRPITGKFIHKSKNVYDLYFEGSSEPLGVTANHLIWSITRQGWIEASKLFIGEEVQTIDKKNALKLERKETRPGVHTVYNLEVYRTHNYHVSGDGILVHNVCWWDLAEKLYKNPTLDVAHDIRTKANKLEISQFVRLVRYQKIDNLLDGLERTYKSHTNTGDYLDFQIRIDITDLSRSDVEKIAQGALHRKFTVLEEGTVYIEESTKRYIHIMKKNPTPPGYHAHDYRGK